MRVCTHIALAFTIPMQAVAYSPRMRLRLPLLLCAAMFCICVDVVAGRGLSPEHFVASAPRLDPMRYFDGHTHSWGVIENRSGEPSSTFRAAMLGIRNGDALTITQDFTFDDGRKQQRIWRIRQIDEHRFDATSSDVIGVATGYAYGNTFRWEYTLQLKPGNALTRVHMKHWMYLSDDGDMMINRVIISKLGIIVGETTEYFQHG